MAARKSLNNSTESLSTKINGDDFRKHILDWYDQNHRSFPWRAPVGRKADPYKVWLSEIMLQQTTVQAVIPYYKKFLQKWPKLKDLANASVDEVLSEWAGLGYYSRARNLHKCANVLLEEYKGIFPPDPKDLKKLPGIGDYTSAAITSIAFDKPAIVMDANIERIMARVFLVKDPLPGAKKILKSYAGGLSEGREDRPGDYAQGLMDLGSVICTPSKPQCGRCPVHQYCGAQSKNIAEELPVKSKSKVKPVKFGYYYWIESDDGYVAFERRPEKGMLAGMLGLPTSEWLIGLKDVNHPEAVSHHVKGKRINKALTVYHSFTHFDLQLTGIKVSVKSKQNKVFENFKWVSLKDVKSLGIPTLFKKAVTLTTS